VNEKLKSYLIENLEKNHLGKQIFILDKFLPDENLNEYNNNALLPVLSLAKA